MFNWGESESSKPTLGQQASQNITLFRKRKQEYLDECLQQLINATTKEILYQSSVGSKEAGLGIDEKEENFPEFTIGLEERQKIYKLSPSDRRTLLNNLEAHFTNKDQFPHLECHQFIRGYGNPKYCIRIQIEDPDKLETSTGDVDQ